MDWGQVRVIRSNDIERTKKLSLPEYPEIASHIKQAIDDVYYGKILKYALDDAAAKSAKVLEW